MAFAQFSYLKIKYQKKHCQKNIMNLLGYCLNELG